MKKTILCAMLAVSLVLVFACKSQPKTTDEQFKSVYDRYRGDLLLDDAGNYTVVSGDTLSKIARVQYNAHDKAGFYFPIIMLASSDVVLDPDKIEPGMVLKIPNLQRNLDDAKAKTAIKNFLTEIAEIEQLRDRPKDAAGLKELAASL